jgi:hypothetical protein
MPGQYHRAQLAGYSYLFGRLAARTELHRPFLNRCAFVTKRSQPGQGTHAASFATDNTRYRTLLRGSAFGRVRVRKSITIGRKARRSALVEHVPFGHAERGQLLASVLPGSLLLREGCALLRWQKGLVPPILCQGSLIRAASLPALIGQKVPVFMGEITRIKIGLCTQVRLVVRRRKRVCDPSTRVPKETRHRRNPPARNSRDEAWLVPDGGRVIFASERVEALPLVVECSLYGRPQAHEALGWSHGLGFRAPKPTFNRSPPIDHGGSKTP